MAKSRRYDELRDGYLPLGVNGSLLAELLTRAADILTDDRVCMPQALARCGFSRANNPIHGEMTNRRLRLLETDPNLNA